ncbi:unnamed protein product [Sphagnum jensenii]|uniref:Uncharacterized protein n=1 Tax=Sphagnum jensenii TaxID=128206 RepID=A0ABP0VCL5_9BRYO
METTVFNVMMLAFETERGEPTKIRKVTVPAVAMSDDVNTLLSRIYRYGQNDVQPQRVCSVSAGDVICIGEKFFLVAMTGFKEITADDVKEIEAMDRRDRFMLNFAK